MGIGTVPGSLTTDAHADRGAATIRRFAEAIPTG